jgi:hypothetical protein
LARGHLGSKRVLPARESLPAFFGWVARKARRPRAPGTLEAMEGRAPDFIGIGAQRAGTSWIYACLYEHPQLCMPSKEIHFFSRDRNWVRGYEWYEALFTRCPSTARVGELSTSYLVCREGPSRIYSRYPEVKLLASLRDPVDRAFSSYLNDIVSGVLSPDIDFWEACAERPEYVEQGLYAKHLRRYLDSFPRDRLLVLIFEDGRRDPLGFMQAIYRFMGVDPSFEPTMLGRRVGEGRVPRAMWFERALVGVSAFLRRRSLLRRVWWRAKKARLGDLARSINTRRGATAEKVLAPADRQRLFQHFRRDIEDLETLLGRQLDEWRS